MLELGVIIVAAAVGGGIGVLLVRSRSRAALREAEQRAAHRLEEARRAAELTQREARTRAAEQQRETEREAEQDAAAVAEQIQRVEQRLAALERVRAQRSAALEQRRQAVEQRAEAASEQREVGRRQRREAKELRRSKRERLEERAGRSAEETKQQLVDGLVEDTRSRCADLLRNLESSGSDEFARQARHLINVAIERYGGHYLRDRSTATIPLGPDDWRKLTETHAEGLDALRDLSGVNIVLADSEDGVRLDTGDGVGRELCRRAIARFLAENKIRDSARLLRAINNELEKEIGELGRKAFNKLRLKQADARLVDLIGRLNWRTSYTQNQYEHAIEAAFLAGLIATELGLDARLARRAALLHDVGKVLSHEQDGSHALNGAELAREAGESATVCNAIASHHDEAAPDSPYAALTAAADALSGGRPGARREMVESYGDRIGDLERIATGFKGVSAAHAVQAGRELRVLVDERKVGDEGLAELSAAIAQEISEKLTFPGQIRVTVIREFRAVETAA